MNLKNLSANKIPKLLKEKLNNKKVKQIYSKFEKSFKTNENFAVAVSGGPDSLALAFLAKIYSIKNNINPRFLIVDHKLRKESSAEAKYVKKLLKKYLISAEILPWKGKKPSQNIQAIARNKRYELLFERCKKLKINNILLGHHQNDLFENFFIRILRGSGLKGLISLDKSSKVRNINLLRPLLDQDKSNLEFLSKYVFNSYVKDPSNKEEKYQRTKVRKFIEILKKNGLDNKKFSQTIKNLKDSDNVVNYYVNQNLMNNIFFQVKKNRLILNKEFFLQPHEVIFRSFSDSIKLIGRKYYPVRGKKLDKIIIDLRNNEYLRLTLGGCIIEKVKETVIISREH